MRLGIIRQRYNPHGGAERFIERALAPLSSEGVSCTVFAREWSGSGGMEVVRCDPFYLGRVWRDWSFARAVCRATSETAVDLVQSHERIGCCDVYRAGDGVHAQWLANRARVLGAPGRLALGLSPWHHYVKSAERRLFASPRLRAVICNSRMVKAEIRAHFGVADSKLHVIHNGVDLEEFHPGLRAQHRAEVRARLGIPDDALVHLFVGSGFERKGVSRLLAAFARGADRNARLVVIGSDRKERRARAQAGKLGIAGRAHFIGGQDDVRPWYGAADTFVLPTLYDPFPNAALEAMASALPVITTTQCGAAELIEAGKNGFVCDALDETSLAGFLSIKRERARDMGQNARKTALAYGFDAMARRLAELYRGLLAASSDGRLSD